MIKLKTKTEFPVFIKRAIANKIIYLTLDSLWIDTNNVRAQGYYYYIDENNRAVVLDSVDKLYQWESIEALENSLPALTSNTSLKSNLLQRLLEFTMYQLSQEEGENYSTSISDWEAI
jgi:hypothetical protein